MTSAIISYLSTYIYCAEVEGNPTKSFELWLEGSGHPFVLKQVKTTTVAPTLMPKLHLNQTSGHVQKLGSIGNDSE